MSEYKLFSEFKLGDITLKNRVVMAPMTRSRAVEKNTANSLMSEYYEQRSEAGLIITEGTSPSPNGLGYPRIPGLFNQGQVEGWKLVTEKVHAAGSKIFLQFMHTGAIGHIENLPADAQVISPSGILVSGQMYVDGKGMLDHTAPTAMTTEQVKSTIQEFINSAKLAIEAGFDGVEIHGANGYLVEQFINPKANERTDEYGGSNENRSRFAIEIAQGMADAIGKDKVGIRLSPYGVFNEMGEFDGIDAQFEYLAKELNQIGIAYIHVVDHSHLGAPEVPQKVKDIIRDNFKGVYILSGGYTKERAEKDLQANKGELVAFGVPFIANPDLVTRMKKDLALSNPDQSTFYTPGVQGYSDYPKAN
ncbi:MAG: N-ethylmaleimide reductase [Roseivirga sp.]|jgi:N-ethylmaleimide reductase